MATVTSPMKKVLNDPADEIIILGGGARNQLLNQWIADATGLPVRIGAFDATALGNGLVQALALGWIDSLEEGRRLVQDTSSEVTYQPHSDVRWQAAKAKLQEWETI